MSSKFGCFRGFLSESDSACRRGASRPTPGRAGVAQAEMWARDASHVASAALGAYAFSEIAARVVGDAVAPDTARWLTLVALAVVAAAFALVARADARRARADSAEAERRARRGARFRAAVLESFVVLLFFLCCSCVFLMFFLCFSYAFLNVFLNDFLMFF